MVNFELIVRALIIKNKRILVCKTEGRGYFFLPGGHIEFSETMHNALHRELWEELGVRLTAVQFLGGVENLFEQDGVKKHEVSFLFHADIDTDDVVSKEAHIMFFWMSEEEFIKQNIAPPALKDAIVKWIADRQPFFIEEGINR